MSKKSWHLDRRTFLMGTGVSLGLPWLECMAEAKQEEHAAPAAHGSPRRFAALYFGFGVGLPKEESAEAKWRWFPKGEGKEFQFTETLKPLDNHRDHLTVLGGLSHPNGRKMGGHDTGDTFLTGAFLNNKSLRNTVSLDQVIANELSDQTRFSSLVMSTDGGVGEPTRSSTLSYDNKGRPLPAFLPRTGGGVPPLRTSSGSFRVRGEKRDLSEAILSSPYARQHFPHAVWRGSRLLSSSPFRPSSRLDDDE